jgi:hypothetical protein
VYESLRYDQCRGEWGNFVINCFILCAIESRRTPTGSFGEIREVKDDSSIIVWRSELVQMGKCGCEGRRRRYKNVGVKEGEGEIKMWVQRKEKVI